MKSNTHEDDAVYKISSYKNNSNESNNVKHDNNKTFRARISPEIQRHNSTTTPNKF